MKTTYKFLNTFSLKNICLLKNSTHKKHSGFTLLELMVAISIFAIISLLAMGGLSQVLDTQAHTEKKMQSLTQFQMFFTIMSRELQQLSLRPIRDEYGAVIGSLNSETSEGIAGIEFTHQGRFTLGNSTSLQRVAYYLEDHQLIKKIWPVLDRVEDSQAIKRVVLKEIDELNFSFYQINASDTLAEQTNEAQINWQSSFEEDDKLVLRAIKVSLQSNHFGELYRVFEIVH